MEELKLERQISPLRPVILGGMLVVPQGLIALMTGRPAPALAASADTQAAAARARQYATMQSQGQLGQAVSEQQAYQMLVNNPQAMAEVRAPLFEDKVVDFIAELAQVDERKVDRDILFLDPDEAREKLKGCLRTDAVN